MRVLTTVVVFLLVLTGVSFIALDPLESYRAIGGTPTDERTAVAAKAGNWADGKFHNLTPSPTLTGVWDTLQRQFLGKEQREPPRPIPVHQLTRAELVVPETSLRAVWIGHASVLLQIDGQHVLTDPIWSDRASPSQKVGPKRFFPPPIALADLPPIDAVVISHDHYDHLDMATIIALAQRGTRFVVPLGIGAHLDAWQVDAKQVTELNWGQSTQVGKLTITSTPARHYSGRLITRDKTLWSSWVIAGPQHKVFFSGDSGYFDEFKKIGAAYGPFDLTLIKIGAYGETWLPIHMSAEDAVRTHVDLRGRVMLPVHWGTFNLAFHDWNEPAIHALKAAKESAVRIAFPKPGEIVDVDKPVPAEEWWK
ncbi:MAG TPA: MBL fold metallo-hydrolase [bacterium]